MIRILLMITAFSFSFVLAEQAERDVPDATDSLKIHPLTGLHYINLALESEAFEELGITGKKPGDNYYFRVEGDSELTKVSYFGTNLSEYVTNVEPSYKLLNEYRNLRMTYSGMLYGGLLVTLLGGVFSAMDNSLSPTLFVGIGIFSLSWIPNYFSKNKIPEAVGIYNKAIQSHQDMQQPITDQ